MSLLTYIRETKAELKHVSWPTKKQALLYTVVVIVVSVAVGVYLGLLDYLLSLPLKNLLS